MQNNKKVCGYLLYLTLVMKQISLFLNNEELDNGTNTIKDKDYKNIVILYFISSYKKFNLTF